MKTKLQYLLVIILLFSGFFLAFTTQGLANSNQDDESSETEETTTTTTEEDDDETSDEDVELEDEEDAEKEDAYERELKFEIDANQVEIESKLKFGGNKDKFEIEFEVESGEEPEIELKYSTETDDLESELEFRVEFEQIIEYVDIGTADNGYQEGEEVFVYELDEIDWNDIVYIVEIVSGVDVHVITATTSDNVFTIVLRVSGSILQLDNSILTPNSLKFDIEFHDFPYTMSGSSLALKTDIKTESEREFKGDTDEELAGFGNAESQVGIGNSFAQGFFSWAETAVADGLVISVLTSSLVDSSDEQDDLLGTETSETIFFSFIATDAQDIVYDPKVGVQSQGTLSEISAIEIKYDELRANASSSSVPGFELFGILLTTGMVSAIALARRHRRS